ncbi:MAG: hypothetical protein U5K75_09900 [Ahrensia sp.]|nr:hypothetical protein [Ahrensia sp.]
MSNEVWVSSIMSDSSYGKQGAREKYFNRPWAPASDMYESWQDADFSITHQYKKGINVGRENLTEAMFVFDKKKWSRIKDFFYAGNFMAVKGRLAEVLHQFDLGDGALYEFPVYEADQKTLAEGGPYYVLSFGCIKDTVDISQSKNLRKVFDSKYDRYDKWSDYGDLKDGEMAVYTRIT